MVPSSSGHLGNVDTYCLALICPDYRSSTTFDIHFKSSLGVDQGPRFPALSI